MSPPPPLQPPPLYTPHPRHLAPLPPHLPRLMSTFFVQRSAEATTTAGGARSATAGLNGIRCSLPATATTGGRPSPAELILLNMRAHRGSIGSFLSRTSASVAGTGAAGTGGGGSVSPFCTALAAVGSAAAGGSPLSSHRSMASVAEAHGEAGEEDEIQDLAASGRGQGHGGAGGRQHEDEREDERGGEIGALRRHQLEEMVVDERGRGRGRGGVGGGWSQPRLKVLCVDDDGVLETAHTSSGVLETARTASGSGSLGLPRLMVRAGMDGSTARTSTTGTTETDAHKEDEFNTYHAPPINK